MVLTTRKTAAQRTGSRSSPATTPWVEELPNEITPLPEGNLSPAPTEAANREAGEIGRAQHQRFVELGGPTAKHYELTASENPRWIFNPAYPPQAIWGYSSGTAGVASTPGPTMFARYGEPRIVRIHNRLPYDHVGIGTPEISTHLHNMHTPSESDGFPGDYYGPKPGQAGPTLSAPGDFNDHFYPNCYAGYDEFPATRGDPREALGTLFYHDHTLDFTAPNVVRGLLGFCLMFDDVDTGNEQTGLRLPSHPYDYPIALADRRFDAQGLLYYDQMNPEGTLGDKTVVNGKIEPVLRVARRKYRLRFLNGGPSRFYALALQDRNRRTLYTFTYIASDGNLLPAPLLDQRRVVIGPAERADIVIDFSRFRIGTELYLVNQMRQEDTREPKDIRTPGTQILKIIVDREPPTPDLSVVPAALRPLRPLPSDAEIAALPKRRWLFDRSKGMWQLNDRFFDVFRPGARVPIGSTEVWELVNVDDGWSHPIHMHFEEGRILSRIREGANVPLPAHERGRKDIFVLGPLETLRVLFRFRDFKGKYVLHCHNLTHEDHAMMVRIDIV